MTGEPFWPFDLGYDFRQLLAWAIEAGELDQSAGVGKKVAAAIESKSKTINLTRAEFYTLNGVGILAEASETHHRIVAGRFLTAIENAQRTKPAGYLPVAAAGVQPRTGEPKAAQTKLLFD